MRTFFVCTSARLFFGFDLFSLINYTSNGGWLAANMAAMQISQVVTIPQYVKTKAKHMFLTNIDLISQCNVSYGYISPPSIYVPLYLHEGIKTTRL